MQDYSNDSRVQRLHFVLQVRKEVNKLDNMTTGKAVDALLNYETVKLFNNEQLEVSQPVSQVSCMLCAMCVHLHTGSTKPSQQSQADLFSVTLKRSYRPQVQELQREHGMASGTTNPVPSTYMPHHAAGE